jgi:hypothetical protein
MTSLNYHNPVSIFPPSLGSTSYRLGGFGSAQQLKAARRGGDEKASTAHVNVVSKTSQVPINMVQDVTTSTVTKLGEVHPAKPAVLPPPPAPAATAEVEEELPAEVPMSKASSYMWAVELCAMFVMIMLIVSIVLVWVCTIETIQWGVTILSAVSIVLLIVVMVYAYKQYAINAPPTPDG